jgi:hypothetical protein
LKDFFVSYNKADQRWAEWIAWQLEAAGYTVVFQAWDFAPGTNFVLKMHEAVADSARTVAVLSPDFLRSSFTQPEWAAALAGDPTGQGRKLVPIRVRDCEPAGLLKQISCVDLVSADEETAKARLLDAARGARGKPSVQPQFPGGAADDDAPKGPNFPGAFPPIWHVPYGRNPNFTGRSATIASLREDLRSGQPAAVTQAISGLGGIGKTQLAIEYAYRYAADYQVVWWIRAEKPDSRNADIRELAAALELQVASDDADAAIVARAVQRWLDRNDGWLLIFDNVEEPVHIQDLLPKAGRGHVLITSRHRSWANIAKPVLLNVWSVEESVEYLRQRTGQDEPQASRALADALGYLPLALEQAAAYIEESGVGISDYKGMFERHLLKKGAAEARTTVATLWEISLRKVAAADAAAVPLLQFLAFLPPDRISREMLMQRAGILPKPLSSTVADTLAFNDAIAALRRYSLIDSSTEFISVHRLVQLVVRERLDDREFRTFSEAANRLQHGGEEASLPAGTEAPARTVPRAAASVVGLGIVGTVGWFLLFGPPWKGPVTTESPTQPAGPVTVSAPPPAPVTSVTQPAAPVTTETPASTAGLAATETSLPRVEPPQIPFADERDVSLKDPDNPSKVFRVDFARVQHEKPLSRSDLMKITPENIGALSQEQVDQLYARLTAGPIPDGEHLANVFVPQSGFDMQGRLSEILGGLDDLPASTADLLELITRFLWEGKIFERQQGVMRNAVKNRPFLRALIDNIDSVPVATTPLPSWMFQPGEPQRFWLLFPAKIFCGQSLIDGRRESVIIDYNYSDEIRGFRTAPDAIAARGGLRIRDEIRMIRPGFYLGRAYANRMFLLNFTLVSPDTTQRDISAFAGGVRVREDCWPGEQASAATSR